MSDAILCVDDERPVRRLIERLLEPGGYETVTAASVEEARTLLARRSFALVLCDIGFPGSSGLELLDELASLQPQVATMMVTGRDDPALAAAALRAGAYGYVTKPFSENELVIGVANALHRRELELERRDYASRLEETVAARTTELRPRVRPDPRPPRPRDGVPRRRARARTSSASARTRTGSRSPSASTRSGRSCCGSRRRYTTSARSRSARGSSSRTAR